VIFPKDHDENFRSKRIHKKSARWQSGVRLIIIAVSFLVAAIISFSVSMATEGYLYLTGIGLILFFVANIIFIISMFRKVDGYKKIMSKKKLLGIMVLGLVAFFLIPNIAYDQIYSVNYPEEYALQQDVRDLQMRIEKQQQEQQLKQEKAKNLEEYYEKQKQKELDEYESIVTETGRLKYRPYWMVGDKNDEMEMNGEIIKSQECADLVTMIFEVEHGTSLQTTIHKQWVETCIRFR